MLYQGLDLVYHRLMPYDIRHRHYRSYEVTITIIAYYVFYSRVHYRAQVETLPLWVSKPQPQP